MAITLVQTKPPAKVAPAKKKSRNRAFKIPLLSEMSPAQQRAYVEEAHDAILATRLVHRPELTVKEALLLLPQLKLTEQSPSYERKAGQIWSGTLESDLQVLGVQLSIPRSRLVEGVRARAEAGYDVSKDENLEALREGPFAVPPMYVVGVTAQPIGYATNLEKTSRPEYRAAQKPIRHYFDVVPALGWGLPLYHDEFKHLIDMAEVLERHLPVEALEERHRAERRAAKVSVEQLAEDAPNAALAKAFQLILSASIQPRFTVRQAIRIAQHAPHQETATVEERMRVRRLRFEYETMLYNSGILVAADGAQGGEIVDPGKLLRLYELRVLAGMEEQLLGLRLPV